MAPKNKKNGYVIFAESRRADLLATGHKLNGGLPQLLSLCTADWEKLSPEEKGRYNEQAKALNASRKASGVGTGKGKEEPSEFEKFWSLGRDPYEFTPEEKATFDANRQVVLDMFENDPNWRAQPIVICSFTSYLEPDHHLIYYPAEIGLTAMNVTQGVLDNYARIIDPTPVQRGYGKEAAQTATRFGLPQIGSVPELADLRSLMTTVLKFLFRYKGNLKGNAEIYVFCHNSDYLFVTRCLEVLIKKTGCPVALNVLSLDLYAYLASSTRDIDKRGPHAISPYRKMGVPLGPCIFPEEIGPGLKVGVFCTEAEVDRVIKQYDNYRYFEELSCVYHLKSGKEIQNCALVCSNRYAFSLLEILTLSNPVKIIPGGHHPNGNVEAEKNRRMMMLSNWGITSMEQNMEFYSVENVEQPTDDGPDKFRRGNRRANGDEPFGETSQRRRERRVHPVEAPLELAELALQEEEAGEPHPYTGSVPVIFGGGNVGK